MLRILKFVERSSIVESFSVLDFKRSGVLLRQEGVAIQAPHYPSLETHPSHLHIQKHILFSHCSDPVKILSWIEKLIKRQIDLKPENLIHYLDELR